MTHFAQQKSRVKGGNGCFCQHGERTHTILHRLSGHWKAPTQHHCACLQKPIQGTQTGSGYSVLTNLLISRKNVFCSPHDLGSWSPASTPTRLPVAAFLHLCMCVCLYIHIYSFPHQKQRVASQYLAHFKPAEGGRVKRFPFLLDTTDPGSPPSSPRVLCSWIFYFYFFWHLDMGLLMWVRDVTQWLEHMSSSGKCWEGRGWGSGCRGDGGLGWGGRRMLPDVWINSAAFIWDWCFLLQRSGLWNAHSDGSFFYLAGMRA